MRCEHGGTCRHGGEEWPDSALLSLLRAGKHMDCRERGVQSTLPGAPPIQEGGYALENNR